MNKSSESRKIQINTSQSPFFEFLYNKKSKIAPGMHETIIINFKPNDYSFFSSNIRLKLQTDTRRTPFLPKIPFGRSIENESLKVSNFAVHSNDGETQRGKIESYIVAIEAYPKMSLSLKKRYLPKIIGSIWLFH